MRKGFALLIAVGVTFMLSATIPAATPIAAMILDGQSGGPYHAWQQVTPALKKMLEDTGLFKVDVVTSPVSNGDFSN